MFKKINGVEYFRMKGVYNLDLQFKHMLTIFF
jgi:hypothetical protein